MLQTSDGYDTINVKWLKSLKDRVQPKQEWSLHYEKNETVEKLIALAECLEADGDCLFNGLSGDDYGKFLRVLAKELTQPKQEWSEKDKEIIETICKEGDLKPSERVWLKSLIPQSQWRPSEEQMHYLSWIANVKLGDSVVEQEVSKHLNELLEDLKRLREE